MRQVYNSLKFTVYATSHDQLQLGGRVDILIGKLAERADVETLTALKRS